MKKFLLLLLCAVGLVAAAQTHYVPHVSVGAHAGMTLSQMDWSPSVKQKMVSGMAAGVAFKYAEERHVGLLAELNISQRGWQEDFEGAPFSYKRQLTYLELPVMTHIFFGSRTVKGFINLGPEVGIMLSDKITADFDYLNPKDVPGFPIVNRSYEQMAMDIKNKFDYGITAGAGVEFVIKRRHSITLEGRYYYGLGNIYGSRKKDAFSASRGQSILITLGYMFRLK